MEHTPGPWDWRKPDHPADSNRLERGDLGGIWAGGREVITCGVDERYYPSCGIDPSEADARLIVAAPEMFEVLQSLENDAGQMPDFMWRRVQDVIEKAGGKRKL